ncbi:MAG: dUTP diphosphatase [Planctomycetota bacterium]
MSRPLLRILRLAHAADLPLPRYETEHSAGLDLRAALPEEEPLALHPGERALVPTGLRLEIPEGHEGQVRPRSGMAVRHGVTVLNAPGTIDADYRGEVQVILYNAGQQQHTITRGERIAQLVIAPVSRVVLEEARDLSTTERGEGGFGSTGTA